MDAKNEAPLDYGGPAARANNLPMLVIAWLIVGVPAAWGVTQTFKQSLKLFRSAPAPAPAATTQPSAAQPQAR